MGNLSIELTSQEKRFVLLRCSGMSLRKAAEGAGYDSSLNLTWFVNRAPIIAAMKAFKDTLALEEGVVFGVSEAHQMLMEAWANAANSTEQRLVVDSLMKLHRLGETPKGSGSKSVTININKLDQMSDEKLLKLAGKAGDYLDLDD